MRRRLHRAFGWSSVASGARSGSATGCCAAPKRKAQGFIAHPMKKLASSAELALGVVKREGDRFWLSPVDKRERRELFISDLKDAEAGDLVLCEVTGRPPRVSARVDAVLGDPVRAAQLHLIAIHKHGLRHEFAQEAIDEAHRVSKQPLGEREDLTHLPIVAIDPEDARDHDDAIWAEARRRRRLERDRRDRRRQFLRPSRLRARPRGARRAATASISPTASCRCFPRSCRPTSAR